MKICLDCGIEKPLSEYYVHKNMLNGHLNKCKTCVKLRTSKYYRENSDYYKEYDKKRANLPDRVQARKDYSLSDGGKLARRRAQDTYRKKFPMKYAAHTIFSRAVKDGRVIRSNTCSECGSNRIVEGHHDDYTKPLDVRWLCVKCHVAWHKINEPIYE